MEDTLTYPEHRHRTQAAGNVRYTPSAVTGCIVAKCMSVMLCVVCSMNICYALDSIHAPILYRFANKGQQQTQKEKVSCELHCYLECSYNFIL